MKQVSSHRGSALLIVLGILSFMIVSAVAFSAFMRSARLPSSYLRRTVASRQLIKAALANAIDKIDQGIGNNPHPGVGTVGGNTWQSRVYMGAPGSMLTEDEMDLTIPVLTVEGLAYLPPPLVNEVRYYSRRSPTARWQALDFDAGRYAFCAVDVSDYLDVNRLTASEPRSSAAAQRISLGYLFEEEGGDPQKWDKWLEGLRTPAAQGIGFSYDEKVPLVSLADFNLQLGATGQDSGLKSPFYEYFGNKNQQAFDTIDPRMTFVTDSYLPNPPTTNTVFDLSTPEGQPFQSDFMDGSRKRSFGDIFDLAEQEGSSARYFRDKLSLLGLICLCDYLDQDQVPISLAIPSVERIPMLCAIQPKMEDATLSVKEASPNGEALTDENGNALGSEEGETRRVFQKVSYYLNGIDKLTGLTALYAYPFAHADGSSSSTYTIDGRLSLFFTVGEDADSLKFRTSSNADQNMLRFTAEDSEKNTAEITGTGLINIPFEGQKSFAPNATESSAVVEVPLPTPAADALAWDTKPFLEIIYSWDAEWKELDTGEGGSYFPSSWKTALKDQDKYGFEVHQVTSSMPPIHSNGIAYTSEELTKKIQALPPTDGTIDFKLNAAVWVRALQGDTTVDLVPACILDDQEFLEVDNTSEPMLAQELGKTYPLLHFDLGTGVTLSNDPEKGLMAGLKTVAAVNTPAAVKPNPAVLFIDDPRYNHAPENWKSEPGLTSLSPEQWVQKTSAHTRSDDNANADADIFLATSDQGYLQSVYELAFLPRLTNIPLGINENDSNYFLPGSQVATGLYKSPMAPRDNYEAAAVHQALMWGSYQPYFDDYEAIKNMNEKVVSGDCGFRINPYTDSLNVMMAVFANTPLDWRCCSTNTTSSTVNQIWDEAKFPWDDLEGIADAAMKKFRLASDWNDAWKTLWQEFEDSYTGSASAEGGASHAFGDYPVSAKLNSADRKYLYGFWTDCFAAKQQLFLVFVRAEPLMMGGGEGSHIPPQLGARAVALVWRDPAPTPTEKEGNSTGYPHRTRVLFYKQLD